MHKKLTLKTMQAATPHMVKLPTKTTTISTIHIDMPVKSQPLCPGSGSTLDVSVDSVDCRKTPGFVEGSDVCEMYGFVLPWQTVQAPLKYSQLLKQRIFSKYPIFNTRLLTSVSL
jgi:hypothetical protein